MTDINELADILAQEIKSRDLKLDGVGNEHNIQMDAARVTRKCIIDGLGIRSQYVPTINEIRAYSTIYNRALELLNQSEAVK